MHPSRATLATTGLLLSLLASCSEQTVVPTEPSRVATMPSIPGSSSVTVRTGQEAEQFLDATAAAWARRGDARLAQDLEAQRAQTVRPELQGARPGGDAQYRPSISPSATEMTPSPTTTPDAFIYYSSTVPYVNGRTAAIVSSVTYFGNIAITTVSYRANDAAGTSSSRVARRPIGAWASAPTAWGPLGCARGPLRSRLSSRSIWGRTVESRCGHPANHTAQWTTPAAYKLPAAIWGSTFAAIQKSARPMVHARLLRSVWTPARIITVARSVHVSSARRRRRLHAPIDRRHHGASDVSAGALRPQWPLGVRDLLHGHRLQKEYCTWYADYARVPKSSPRSR
jgi:hypothetical protein